MSNNKKYQILLTGASGFLGEMFFAALKTKYFITSLGRSSHNQIVVDLSSDIPKTNEIFDCVLHNAGKAHTIPKTKAEKQTFFDVNEKGTLHLLKALDKLISKPKSFIFISTVAVYGLEQGKSIDENAPLKGITPYALSKINAESHIQSWCNENEVNCVILRLPLVIGKDAPGNLRAIRKAIKRGYYFSIKGNKARKSIVLAQDIAQLIPRILDKNGIYNLTDDEHPLFIDIEKAIAKSLGKKIPFTLSKGLVKFIARIGDVLLKLTLPAPLYTEKLNKMTSSLTFSNEKAKKELGWRPNSVLNFLQSNCQN